MNYLKVWWRCIQLYPEGNDELLYDDTMPSEENLKDLDYDPFKIVDYSWLNGIGFDSIK